MRDRSVCLSWKRLAVPSVVLIFVRQVRMFMPVILERVTPLSLCFAAIETSKCKAFPPVDLLLTVCGPLHEVADFARVRRLLHTVVCGLPAPFV